MPETLYSRVLCVDDHEDSCEMLRTMLESCRIETTAVATAAQALSAIQRESYDLYLLEAWLPGVDGFELCRRMRESDAHTPILFYSSAAYDADIKKGVEAGANGYVIKPDISDLLGHITQFVPYAESAVV